MNNKIITIIFVVIVAVVLGAGIWYNNQASERYQAQQMAQSQLADQAQAAAAQQQKQTEHKAMQNLKIMDVTVGTGAEAKQGDTVNVLYTGSLDNGTVFDASSKHGNQPFSFTIGAGQVIRGWDVGVAGMKVGGKRTLLIPPELGYGAQGAAGGVIPPNAALHFTIQLLSIATGTPAQP
jgi:FKBP-type peptidyl-prolyl cis-trans isomerase